MVAAAVQMVVVIKLALINELFISAAERATTLETVGFYQGKKP